MNRFQKHNFDMNQHLANMAKVQALPPALRHYGQWHKGIVAARANGWSNLQIAEEIHKQVGAGPLERRKDGSMGLNREVAAVYISQVVNHSKI